jgi:hypothetical protein
LQKPGFRSGFTKKKESEQTSDVTRENQGRV